MDKVVVIDFGIFSHRAIFATMNNPKIPSTYTCFNMMLSSLGRIGVNPDDKIIIACDGRSSWRKEYEKAYKADRAKKRAESPIDWNSEYTKMNQLLENIDKATDWHIIKLDHIEADDIMAVASRYYKDKEVILVTYDSDLEQCWSYTNVKIFSIMKKSKGGKGAYKIKPKNFNVYKFLAKKVNKEVSDNLVSPILNEEDYDNRMICINLLELPQWVENTIIKELKELKVKKGNFNLLWFKNLRPKLNNLYNSTKILTYDYCKELLEKRKRRKKNGKVSSNSKN